MCPPPLPTPPLEPSALCYDVWCRELTDDDHSDNATLLEGIKHGLHIVDSEVCPDCASMSNYKLAIRSDNFAMVQAPIVEELEEGRYIVSSDKPQIVSALGAIAKSSGGVWLIHDCSRPPGLALNYHAPLGEKLRFQFVDDAVRLLYPGGYSAKVDLRSAYRSVKLHPSNFAFTGLSWNFSGDDEPTYVFDTRLPFGSSLAPKIFHRLTQAVKHMLAHRGYDKVAYLNDFYIHETTFQRCMAAVHTLVQLLRSLGFAINWKKIEGPSTRITFLGIVIDSESFTLELPDDKMYEFRVLLQHFATKRRAGLCHLRQLAGHLNWACQVVRGGRCYLRRILDIMRPLKHAYHKVLLSGQFYADIVRYVNFMAVFNGRCLSLQNAPSHEVYLDAFNGGAGYVFDTDWGYTNCRTTCPQQLCYTLMTPKFCLPFWRPDVGPPCGPIHECCFTQTTTLTSCSSQGFCQVPSHYATVA